MTIDLNDYPPWSIFLISFVSILGASEIGRRLGLRASKRGGDCVSGARCRRKETRGRTIWCFGMDAVMPTLATIGFLQHHPSPPLPDRIWVARRNLL